MEAAAEQQTAPAPPRPLRRHPDRQEEDPARLVFPGVRLRSYYNRIPVNWDPMQQYGYWAVYGSQSNRRVYLARAPDGQPVVVKSFHESNLLERNNRLLYSVSEEIQNHESYAHTGIVPLLAVFKTKGWLHLVFEKASRDLESFWRTRPEATEQMEVGLLQPLLRHVGPALAYLHQCGLTHGDLKPQNIVLDPCIDARGKRAFIPRLIDLGGLAPVGSIREFTPRYVAPEVATAFQEGMMGSWGCMVEGFKAMDAATGPLFDCRALAQIMAEVALGRRYYTGEKLKDYTHESFPFAPKPLPLPATTRPSQPLPAGHERRPRQEEPPAPVERKAPQADVIEELLQQAFETYADPHPWRQDLWWGDLSPRLRAIIDALGEADPTKRVSMQEALRMEFVTADIGNGTWSFDPTTCFGIFGPTAEPTPELPVGPCVGAVAPSSTTPDACIWALNNNKPLHSVRMSSAQTSSDETVKALLPAIKAVRGPPSCDASSQQTSLTESPFHETTNSIDMSQQLLAVATLPTSDKQHERRLLLSAPVMRPSMTDNRTHCVRKHSCPAAALSPLVLAPSMSCFSAKVTTVDDVTRTQPRSMLVVAAPEQALANAPLATASSDHHTCAPKELPVVLSPVIGPQKNNSLHSSSFSYSSCMASPPLSEKARRNVLQRAAHKVAKRCREYGAKVGMFACFGGSCGAACTKDSDIYTISIGGEQRDAEDDEAASVAIKMIQQDTTGVAVAAPLRVICVAVDASDCEVGIACEDDGTASAAVADELKGPLRPQMHYESVKARRSLQERLRVAFEKAGVPMRRRMLGKTPELSC